MLCLAAHAQQQPIGHVAMQDATVTGTLEVTEGQATLSGGASIVAKDHTAQLELRRGGSGGGVRDEQPPRDAGGGDGGDVAAAVCAGPRGD